MFVIPIETKGKFDKKFPVRNDYTLVEVVREDARKFKYVCEL